MSHGTINQNIKCHCNKLSKAFTHKKLTLLHKVEFSGTKNFLSCLPILFNYFPFRKFTNRSVIYSTSVSVKSSKLVWTWNMRFKAHTIPTFARTLWSFMANLWVFKNFYDQIINLNMFFGDFFSLASKCFIASRPGKLRTKLLTLSFFWRSDFLFRRERRRNLWTFESL